MRTQAARHALPRCLPGGWLPQKVPAASAPVGRLRCTQTPSSAATGHRARRSSSFFDGSRIWGRPTSERHSLDAQFHLAAAGCSITSCIHVWSMRSFHEKRRAPTCKQNDSEYGLPECCDSHCDGDMLHACVVRFKQLCHLELRLLALLRHWTPSADLRGPKAPLCY